MKESDHAQELHNPNVETESLDAGLESEGDGKDLDNFGVVVSQVDEESNSSSSCRGIVVEPIATSTPKHQRFMVEPIATSTPKDFTEHALYQGKTEVVLEKSLIHTCTEKMMILKKILIIQYLVVIRKFLVLTLT